MADGSRRDHPPDAPNASEKDAWAYTVTKAIVDWSPFSFLPPIGRTKIERTTLGNLTGYTLRKSSGLTKEMWTGYLYSGHWEIYVNLETGANGE